MKTLKRRPRNVDPLANIDKVQAILQELREQCPTIIPKSINKLISLLNAARYAKRNPIKNSKSGKSSKFSQESLLEVASKLEKILFRETKGRVSISSFVGLYLRILFFPKDISDLLGQSIITLQEATILARLTDEKLNISPAKAETIRQEVIMSHIKKQGSQNSLRLQVKEILGESNLVSSETLSIAIEKADNLIKLDPYDKRHFLYENFKVMFYAMRQLEPHQIDDELWQEINHASDLLLSAVIAAQNRDKPQKVTLHNFTI